jgi:hypothetical protein
MGVLVSMKGIERAKGLYFGPLRAEEWPKNGGGQHRGERKMWGWGWSESSLVKGRSEEMKLYEQT